MRILRLKLVNFIHIYSGMGKREIELDISNSKNKINIFIGKMGSGKTAILGHLQPFSSYGTLDTRNQIDPIISGENGIKEIDYDINGTIINIQHHYTWNKNSNTHNVKSYIQKDGKELNENGNVKSFKDLIEIEFGIEQNFLRLLRLGPNVANLINMKSTERKSFVASLLEDTEIYTTLYTKLNEDYRSLNGALNVISSKLNSLSAEREIDMKTELSELEEDISELQTNIQTYRDEISKLNGITQTLLNGNIIEEYLNQIETLKIELEELKNKNQEIMGGLNSIPTTNIQNVSIEYGKIVENISRLEEEGIKLSNQYETTQNERNQIRDYLLIQKSDTQIKSLEEKLSEAKKKYYDAANKIAGFQCAYSYEYFTALHTQIETFQYTLEEICASTEDIIRRVFNSDRSITKWTNRQLAILHAKKASLSKLFNNIQFSLDYQPPIPLYIPPFCPTRSCPFIQTHPEVIKKVNGVNVDKRIIEIKDQISAIEVAISQCEDSLLLIPKIDFVKKVWKQISLPLSSIHALRQTDLLKILTNFEFRNNWFDNNQFIDVLEKLKLQKDFIDIKRYYDELFLELSQLKSSQSKYTEDDLTKKEQELDELLKNINSIYTQKQELENRRDEISKMLELIRNREIMEKKYLENESKIGILQKQIETMLSHKDRVNENLLRIKSIKITMEEDLSKYNSKISRENQLRTILADIKSASESYQEYLEKKNIMKLILDAVSSKEGIPVIMVKMFLDECRDIVNDLISDIFDDDLEILDFDLREDSAEFKIPYMINGIIVDDISNASQGQSAVISIALSFALCQKAMFEYNIMLLDEIDNSIHKRDREKFIAILSRQMENVNAEQIFLITHNDIFQQSGLPVNIIMTTDESIDVYPNQFKITLF